ncbi:N-acetylneuraminate synthase [Lachnospiraceae bacterium]|nr:N-acetylneuraminate synthase [Lachnospiraceae bacterium]
MKQFYIGDIQVGGKTPLVIPEIGINHNGNLDIAKKMIDSAARAGAKLIKHQTHICDDEMCSAAKKVVPGNSDKSIFEIMKSCALSEEDELEMKRYAESKGLVFISTPFSRAAADRLEKFGVFAYKIGSGECNNYPLVEHIAEFNKPMIVSTGMNGIPEIAKTVNILEKHGISYALMHTTNLYPTKPEQVRLGAMLEMMKEFPNVPIGLSDHTLSNNACISAMALGAKLVERHFTDTMSRIGPDIVCSMDEEGLKKLIEASETVPLMLGGKKEAIEEEQVTIDFAFASVVTTKRIKKGEIFTKDNIWVKRPGKNGIRAEHYNEILGKKAVEDIVADVQLNWKMIKEV